MANTKKQQENTFVTIIAKAIITATSNKVSDDFKQDTPTKTIYFTVQDEKIIKQLQELGMVLYTPKKKEHQTTLFVKLLNLLKFTKTEMNTLRKILVLQLLKKMVQK